MVGRWSDGRMVDRWLDGQTIVGRCLDDAWMVGCSDDGRPMVGRSSDGRTMVGWSDAWTIVDRLSDDGWKVGWSAGRTMFGLLDGWMIGGWSDGWMIGWTIVGCRLVGQWSDGWIVGWSDDGWMFSPDPPLTMRRGGVSQLSVRRASFQKADFLAGFAPIPKCPKMAAWWAAPLLYY